MQSNLTIFSLNPLFGCQISARKTLLKWWCFGEISDRTGRFRYISYIWSNVPIIKLMNVFGHFGARFPYSTTLFVGGFWFQAFKDKSEKSLRKFLHAEYHRSSLGCLVKRGAFFSTQRGCVGRKRHFFFSGGVENSHILCGKEPANVPLLPGGF